MVTRLPVRSPARLVLPAFLVLALAFLIWLVLNRHYIKPGVLDEAVPLRELKLHDIVTTGLWMGGFGAVLIAMLLGLAWRWWGSSRSDVPFRHKARSQPATGPWFALGIAAIIVFAGFQRWPSMSLSFWGDESWAVCDYVHGKWKPMEKNGSLQDTVRFRKVTWEQTVFGDDNGNNHSLASILQRSILASWQKLTGKPPWAFDERVVRLVSLLGGLGSLVALACLLKRLGRPYEGLLAAMLLALHPWHIRFSVEARGYGLMLFFLVLVIHAFVNAWERGRLRHWFVLGIVQFLTLYSWKGAVYPLAFMNAAMGWMLCLRTFPRRGQKMQMLSRWAAANLFGAMLFLPLAMPSQLQVRKTMDELRGRAKPMDASWAHDTLSGTLTGMPYHEQDAVNPYEVSIQRLVRHHPSYGAGFLLMAMLLLLGMFVWWKRNDQIGLLFTAWVVSAIVAALHFKYGLHVELLPWYLLYCVPLVALLSAAAVMKIIETLGKMRIWQGVRPSIAPFVITAVVLMAYGFLWRPMTHDLQTRAREDHKGAWQIVRGQYEEPGYAGRSKIHTAWLWRHGHLYDPRGDVHVRSTQALQHKMNLAASEDGEFYMVIGNEELCDLLCPDMMTLLRDTSQFDCVQTLWGTERLNTLYVYKMRKAPLHRTLVKQEP